MLTTSTLRRLTLATLVVVSLALLAGCGGSQSGTGGAPLTLEQRLVRAGQLADWSETAPPATIGEATTFVDQIRDTLIAATPAQAIAELERLGFAGASFSSLGKPPNHVEGGSAVVELGSEADARAVQDWAVRDSLSPCPNICTVDITEFEVGDIPQAVGIHRTRQPDSTDPPFQYYEVSFTDGPFYYVVLAWGDPAHMVSKDDVIASARDLWEQVRGRPLPADGAPQAVASQGG